MKELYELYSSYTPAQFFLALSMCAALLFFVFFVSVFAVYFLFNRLANRLDKTNKKTDLKKVLLITVLINAYIWFVLLINH